MNSFNKKIQRRITSGILQKKYRNFNPHRVLYQFQYPAKQIPNTCCDLLLIHDIQ